MKLSNSTAQSVMIVTKPTPKFVIARSRRVRPSYMRSIGHWILRLSVFGSRNNEVGDFGHYLTRNVFNTVVRVEDKMGWEYGQDGLDK